MKKDIVKTLLVVLVFPLILVQGCKEDKLENFELQKGAKSTIIAGGISGNITKSNEHINIPISVKITPSATKAFEASLFIDRELAEDYIAEEGVGDTHVALTSGSVTIPSSVKVAYGADSAAFSMAINRTEIEKHYGKKIVVGYSLTTASKNNIVDAEAQSHLVIFDSFDVIEEEDIHYLRLTNGAGGILELKNQRNYESTSTGLATPIGISLESFPGSSFVVDVESNTDTIEHLVQIGVLPVNTIALESSDFTYDKSVRFASNSKTASLELSVPWSVISEHSDKKLAVLVRLKSASLHVIHPELSHTIVLIDSENVIEIDVTNDGQLSVSRDNRDGADAKEGSEKLIDNRTDTKFLVRDFTGDLWCQIEFDTPQKIGSYTLTSANDAPERDPNEWNLEASNDGENWETIDTREGVVFETRHLTHRFDVQFPEAYKYFRLNLTSNVGNSIIQLAEWRLIRIP